MDWPLVLPEGCFLPTVQTYEPIFAVLINSNDDVSFQSSAEEVKAAVSSALDTGYRHIDTAALYNNEDAIGEAIKEHIDAGKIKREDVYIVTKLSLHLMRAEDVEEGIKSSLRKLQLDYVDLFLLHCPYGVMNDGSFNLKEGSFKLDMGTDHVSLWKAMEEQVDAGRTKSIGISNFNEDQVVRLMKNARIQPACNQVELNAKFRQKPLTELCNKYNIRMVAYAPIGSPGLADAYSEQGLTKETLANLLTNETVKSIATAHGKTPAQVLLNHLITSGVVVIPKSVKPHRIKENFDIFNFTLSSEEISELDALDRGLKGRAFVFSKVFPGAETHPEYPFEI